MQHRFFVFLHTLVLVAVVGALATGLRLSTISRDTWLWLDGLLPAGRVHIWHAFFAVLLLIATLGYVFYRFRTVSSRRKKSLRYHTLVQYGGYAVLLILIVTGVLQTLDYRLPHAALHYYAALGLILYLVLHAYVYFLQWGKALLARIWVPTGQIKLLFALGSVACVSFVTTLWLNHDLVRPLSVAKLDPLTAIDIDGKADEAFWQTAPQVDIVTRAGANFTDGSTPVSVKAVSNGSESYFLFRWHDSTQSLTHLPLVKTAEGWKVTENGFYRFDERSHYEDKFAVMLSPSCQLGGDGTAFLGRQPLAYKPANWHGKGYHAALDGVTRDLWHWKAIRTNDMFLADDNYFAAPVAPRTGERRYTAGYQTDGKESGAYVMNWQWYRNTTVVPKRVPLESTTAQTDSVLPWFGAKPYQAREDHYPLGSQLPSVLYRSNRFEGDRADVRARAQWHDGVWTLEMARKNHTGSSHDVALDSGVCMWVAAFDGAQIAHTHHQMALQLNYPASISTKEVL
ncbi:ethylbenzene dehydrogenase-related protein [Pseudoalteromonas fenneropenaei]|uniref:Ethylbenzene dehydrogenase-related protein n=1 Tax=Pseudoalteromonas fenneropenaei TaxID=1737459 RepID=A0ABV7CGG7_9GAMM